jgi:hypothetical protein
MTAGGKINAKSWSRPQRLNEIYAGADSAGGGKPDRI